MKKCLSLKLHLHCNLRYEKHQKCVSRDSSWSPGLLVDSRDRPRFSWQNSTWVSSNMGVPAKHGHISMIRRTKDHGPLSNPGSVLLFCPLFFFFPWGPSHFQRNLLWRGKASIPPCAALLMAAGLSGARREEGPVLRKAGKVAAKGLIDLQRCCVPVDDSW